MDQPEIQAIEKGRSYGWRVAAETLVLFAAYTSLAWAQGGGFAYNRSITISHTKVGNSNSTNFPMLLSGTYSYLATTANGGTVTSSNGYDIIFTSDSGCSNKLNWEIETYAPTTGAVNIWIQIPTLSPTADTVIYMCYGNSSVTTFQSTAAATWDSNYVGVWHFGNGTTLSTSDSTSKGNNGTNGGATAVPGPTGGAASFNGSPKYIEADGAAAGIQTSAVTYEGWISFPSAYTSSSAYGGIIRCGDDPSYNDMNFSMGSWLTGSDGKLHLEFVTGSSWTILASTQSSWTANVWYHIVGVYSPTAGGVLYINGTLNNSTSTTGRGGTPYSLHFGIGNSPNWDGFTNVTEVLGEMRVSNVARSADWITAEYNNQSSPSAFYVIGADPNGGAPVLTSIVPTSTTEGVGAFVLAVNGTGFLPTSEVQWNGTNLTTTYGNAAQLTAAITAAEVATAGTVTVTVSNPPSGGTSSGATFTINNPPPVLYSITPSQALAGSGGFTLTVNGSRFVPRCVIQWDNTNQPTTFISANQLTATVAANYVASAGLASVTVISPVPGGGTSASTLFSIAPVGPPPLPASSASLPPPTKEYIRLGSRTIAVETASVVVDVYNLQGVAGSLASIPLAVSGQVDKLTISLQIAPSGGAPALGGSLLPTYVHDFQAVTMPTPSVTNFGTGGITIAWSNITSLLGGVNYIGSVQVMLPAGASNGQTYTVQVVEPTTSSFQGQSLVTAGNYAAVTVFVTGTGYLVGDVYPHIYPDTFTGDTYPSFGDGNIDILDLIDTLRAVTYISIPNRCSDRFDAIDSYPVDTGTTRGGDGVLNTLDLLEVLRRVSNVDTSRPYRTPRGLAQCQAIQAQSVRERRNALSQPDAALEIEPDGSIYLHAFHELHLAGLAFAADSTVADPVAWLSAGGVSPTLTDTSQKNIVAVAWLAGLDVPNGSRLLLGRAQTPHTASLRIVGSSANDRQTGADLTISRPASGSRQ